MTDRRTEAIAISPTLFKKKRGDNDQIYLSNPKGCKNFSQAVSEHVGKISDQGDS